MWPDCTYYVSDNSNCGACGHDCDDVFGTNDGQNCLSGQCRKDVEYWQPSAQSCNAKCQQMGLVCSDVWRDATQAGGRAAYYWSESGYSFGNSFLLTCAETPPQTRTCKTSSGFNRSCSLEHMVCNCGEHEVQACTNASTCPASEPVCAAGYWGYCAAPMGCSTSADCPASKPVCATTIGTCVGCTASSCSGALPYCDAASGACVGCRTDADCAGSTPICGPAKKCVSTGGGSCTPAVVISQFYADGGNSGATYANDFVELHNVTGAPVSLSGWSVQYASSTSGSWSAVSLSGSIGPGKYHLVQLAGGAAGSALPTPDATGTANLSATVGKLALVNSTTPLSGVCPSTATAVVDFVGYGSTTTCFVGSGPAPDPSATRSVQRGPAGCTNRGNNANDFANASANPRNSQSPSAGCGCP